MSEKKEYNIAYLQSLIDNQIEENTELEYKGADALKDNIKISKQVSAMANAAGGTIIYGIKEFDVKDKRHLPEKLDFINPTEYSKERLEQVISTIQPKVDGIRITPVRKSENETIYVVEVPQSTTAHQAKDLKYYKRRNFMAEPMEDYEIRDIMNRQKHPKIHLEFELIKRLYIERPNKKNETVYILVIKANNVGMIYAKYINIFIHIPCQIVSDFGNGKLVETNINGVDYYEFSLDNIAKDSLVFIPLLPGISTQIKKINLIKDLQIVDTEFLWSVYADNANPIYGSTKINQIRNKTQNDIIENIEENT